MTEERWRELHAVDAALAFPSPLLFEGSHGITHEDGWGKRSVCKSKCLLSNPELRYVWCERNKLCARFCRCRSQGAVKARRSSAAESLLFWTPLMILHSLNTTSQRSDAQLQERQEKVREQHNRWEWNVLIFLYRTLNVDSRKYTVIMLNRTLCQKTS